LRICIASDAWEPQTNGVVTTLKKSEIKERGKREHSMMPEALVAKLTPAELASVLAFLESLKGQ